jgi:hypothetical protein
MHGNSHRLFKTLVLEGALLIGAAGCDAGDAPEPSGEVGEGEAGEGDADDDGDGDATGTPTDMPATSSDGGDGDGDGTTSDGGDGDGTGETTGQTTGGSSCPDTCAAIDYGLSGEDDWALGCDPITTLCCWVSDSCCDLCC